MTIAELTTAVRRRLVEEQESGIFLDEDLADFIVSAINGYVLPDLFLESNYMLLGSQVGSMVEESLTEGVGYYYYTIPFAVVDEIIPGTLRGTVIVDGVTHNLIFIKSEDIYKYKDFDLAYMRPGKLVTIVGNQVRVYEIGTVETGVTMSVDYVEIYTDDGGDVELPQTVLTKLVIPKSCALACTRMPEYHGQEDKAFEGEYRTGLEYIARLHDRKNHPMEINLVKYQEGGEDK